MVKVVDKKVGPAAPSKKAIKPASSAAAALESAAAGVKAAGGSAQVEVSSDKVPEVNKVETFSTEPQEIEGPPAVVEVGIGKTVNLGNYESARVDVKLTVPCTNDSDAIQATYSDALEWVGERCVEVSNTIKAEWGH